MGDDNFRTLLTTFEVSSIFKASNQVKLVSESVLFVDYTVMKYFKKRKFKTIFKWYRL